MIFAAADSTIDARSYLTGYLAGRLDPAPDISTDDSLAPTTDPLYLCAAGSLLVAAVALAGLAPRR